MELGADSMEGAVGVPMIHMHSLDGTSHTIHV